MSRPPDRTPRPSRRCRCGRVLTSRTADACALCLHAIDPAEPCRTCGGPREHADPRLAHCSPTCQAAAGAAEARRPDAWAARPHVELDAWADKWAMSDEDGTPLTEAVEAPAAVQEARALHAQQDLFT